MGEGWKRNIRGKMRGGFRPDFTQAVTADRLQTEAPDEKKVVKVMRVTREPTRSGCLGRAVIILAIIVVIAMITGIFVVKADGGRGLVTDWLENRLGMELNVEKTRIGFPYVLVIEGVSSEMTGPDKTALFEVESIRLRGGVFPFLKASVKQMDLTMMVSDKGQWRPQSLAPLGDVPGSELELISHITRELRSSMTLSLEESRIRWVDSSGTERASVTGLAFSFAPADIPDNRMYYYHLSADEVVYPGRRKKGLEAEWLSSARYDFIDLNPEGSGKDPGAKRKWIKSGYRGTGEEAELDRKDSDVNSGKSKRDSGPVF